MIITINDLKINMVVRFGDSWHVVGKYCKVVDIRKVAYGNTHYSLMMLSDDDLWPKNDIFIYTDVHIKDHNFITLNNYPEYLQNNHMNLM